MAESEYARFLTDRSYAKDRRELYEECAELFPEAFPWGYAFFGYTEPSMKTVTSVSRLFDHTYGLSHRFLPAFVMPYMTGRALRRRPGVVLEATYAPCWAIALRVWPY